MTRIQIATQLMSGMLAGIMRSSPPYETAADRMMQILAETAILAADALLEADRRA